MATVQERIDELDRLIDGGASSAAEQDRRVVYRPLGELIALRDSLKRELNPTTAARKTRTAVYDKGLG